MNKSQRSFSAGEVSPKLYARTDLDRYQSALRTVRNAIVTKEGGIESRAGTTYIGATKGNGAARIIPFVVSSALPYLIEMGAGYFRFWLEGVQVTATGIGAWTDGATYTAGVVKSDAGINYVCVLGHVASAGPNGPPNATYWHPLTGIIYELPNPYSASEVANVQWADASAGVRFFAHAGYALRELTRTSAEAWTFTVTVFSAADAVTAPTNVQIAGGAGSTAAADTRYRVTAVIGLLESPVSSTVQWSRYPGTTNNNNYSNGITVTWDAVSGATGYRLYRSFDGGTFFLKIQLGAVLTFTDKSTAVTTTAVFTAPSTAQALTDFTVSGSYPGAIGIYQQRLILGGQTGKPDVVYASRTGVFRNYFPHFPLEDDDAISWRQVGPRLNRVLHLEEVAGRLAVWSETTEGVAQGDGDRILRPGEINPTTLSFNGAVANLEPLMVNDTALYVQARGGLVRDLRLSADGSDGADLTVTAGHLVAGFTIADWCYQQTPHSVVWMVRSDGTLISLTYQRETGVTGWARHDTDGTFEAVASVPEGTLDVVYAVVNRTINAGTVRYIEKMANRAATQVNLVLVDAAASTTVATVGSVIDTSTGYSSGAGAIVDAGTPDKIEEDTDTVTGHAVLYDPILFTAKTHRIELTAYVEAAGRTMVNFAYVMWALSETVAVTVDLTAGTVTAIDGARFEVVSAVLTPSGTGYTMALTFGAIRTTANDAFLDANLTGASNFQLLASLMLPPLPGTTSYAGTVGLGVYFEPTVHRTIAVSGYEIQNIAHLNGENVSIVVDGVVIASPNNPAYALATVAAGVVSVPTTGTVAHVGLPITSDVETLDIDKAQGTLKDAGIHITRLGLWFEASRPPFAAISFPSSATSVAGMQQIPALDEDNNVTAALITGYREGGIDGAFNNHGRIALRHVDPTPLTVLAIVPQGNFGRS